MARLAISIGGVGTILAVVLILVFLVAVVLPLARGADVERAGTFDLRADAPQVRKLLVDEYATLAASVSSDGKLSLRRLDTGELLREEELFRGAAPSAQAWSGDSRNAAFGFADGTVRLATFLFVPEFLDERSAPPELASLAPGGVASHEGGVVQRTPDGSLRRQSLRIEVKDAIAVSDTAIVTLDQSAGDRTTVLSALSAAGGLHLVELSERKHLLTGKVSFSSRSFELAYDAPAGRGAPRELLLSGLGDQVLLVWEDGHAIRIDARDRANAAVAEVFDLVPESGERVTATCFLAGKGTLAVGDSLGRIAGWFATRPDGAQTTDGSVWTRAHELAGAGARAGAAVTALAPSPRSRVLAAGYADGVVRVFQMTLERELAALEVGTGAARPAVDALELFPKQDGLACVAGGALAHMRAELGHPEASLGAFFRPIWYEGYPAPAHVWQSTGGTDAFEPKLGLVPLVFGTLKATFYSLLFGAPIAFLAALFTSEFMKPRYRAPIKSVIEVMASLPSVVLGFLAAVVIAPYVQRFLPATLAVLFTLPVSLFVSALAWQLLPRQVALRLAGLPRLCAIAAALVISIVLAAVLGPLAERALFAGNLELWLDGQAGTAMGGWLFLLFPLAALVVSLFGRAVVDPLLRARAAAQSRAGTPVRGRASAARASFARFLASFALALGLALALAVALDAAELDPRRDLFGILGTYVPRNALVVGFAMGFAVIPIIYTLAEDALTSVPEHLRLASLAAGATQWQTATRIVVPAAMSGLFSALMIGLGRAVGETMIVLMATGNTAIMDLNIFNGFRTLSANIAVELPEAAADSTHYRTLFLAGLLLFAMTFVLNTLAEFVRQRFRRRFQSL